MRVLLRRLSRLERDLIGIILLVMVALFASSVVVREIAPQLSRRLDWVDEATRYLMVWIVFLGLGAALAEGKHVAMDSYLIGFPERLRTALRRLIDLVGLVFCLWVALIGIDITRLVFNTGQASPTLGISTGFLYLALPIGFLLLALRYAASLFGLLDRWTAGSELQEGAH